MTAYFNSRVERIYRFSELEDIIKKAITKMDAASDAYQSQGSGWVIFGVENICLKIAKYNPMSGSCRDLNLPQKLKDNRGIVKIKVGNQADEHKCFLHAVAASLQGCTGPHCESAAKYDRTVATLATDGLSFPMKIDLIPKFEKMNSLSINVVTFNGGEFQILYHSKKFFFSTCCPTLSNQSGGSGSFLFI